MKHDSKLIFAVIACWTITSAFGAAAKGPLSRLSANPRYFSDGSGKAVYLTGSYTWANFATDQGSSYPPAPFDYDKFLGFLAAHNHNFFRGWVWDLPYSVQGHNGGPFYWSPFPWLRTGPGEATDGRLKFDLSKFNQAYFDRLRARVIAARDAGSTCRSCSFRRTRFSSTAMTRTDIRSTAATTSTASMPEAVTPQPRSTFPR